MVLSMWKMKMTARWRDMHEEVFWRSRLGAAFRTAWACFLAGVVLQVGSFHALRHGVQWVTFPIFAYVMAVTVVGESTFGKAAQDTLAVVTGTAQGVGMSILVLHVLPPINIGIAIACIALSSFVITYPKSTHILHKRIALAHSGIIYVTAAVQLHRMEELFFPLRLAGTTIVGATCGLIALVLPLPHLATFEVHSQTKLSARITAERLKVLVDAFVARDITSADALRMQAKSLDKIGSAVQAEIRSIEGDFGWEARRLPYRRSENQLRQKVNKGLTSLRKTLVGLELALNMELESWAAINRKLKCRSFNRNMRQSLVYLTDWACLALRHCITSKSMSKQQSSSHKQVIVEEAYEVLSNLEESLSVARQNLNLAGTQYGKPLFGRKFSNRQDNVYCTAQAEDIFQEETYNTDEAVDLDPSGRHLGNAFIDSENIELLDRPCCNRTQSFCGTCAAGGSPLERAPLSKLISNSSLDSSHETGSFSLHYEAQASTFFFLFNLRKFVQDTIAILQPPTKPIVRISHQTPAARPPPTNQQPYDISMLEQAPPVCTPDHPYCRLQYLQSPADVAPQTTKLCNRCRVQKSSSSTLPANESWVSKFCQKLLARLSFKPEPKQLMAAFKMALAMAIGAFLGYWFNNKKGYWADITLALGYTGPAKGGSFRVAIMRTLGTVSGSIYGLMVVMATVNFPVVRLVALIPWVVFTSFLRQSKIFGYAGAVSAFTGAIVILARTNKDSSDQEFTVIRIVEAFLGMASFIIVEVLVFPKRAASMVKPEIISGLGKVQEFVTDVFDAYSGTDCTICGGDTTLEELKSKENKLRSMISRQKVLVKEAGEEPQFWFAPFPSKIFNQLMEEQDKVMEMLHFSIAALEEINQVAKETKIPLDKLLKEPLTDALKIMEEKVLPTLSFLAKVMSIRTQQQIPSEEETHSVGVDAAAAQGRNLHTTGSGADVEAGRTGHMINESGNMYNNARLAELEKLMRSESAACRTSSAFKQGEFGSVADQRGKRFMEAFERGMLQIADQMAAIEAAAEDIAASSPAFLGQAAMIPRLDGISSNSCFDMPLSNTVLLCLGTLAFSLNGLLHHTSQLEKIVHELLQEENPWDLIDFWDTSKSTGHIWRP